MPVSALDANTALIVIDLQKGIVGLPLAHPASEIIRHASVLVDAFRRAGLPVVLVNVTGRPPGRTELAPQGEWPSDFAEFVPELSPQPGDLVVTKQTPGAFSRTDLEAMLKTKGVTQVVIVGIATSMGVESTMRQAYELGFNVTVAIDAMTDRNLDLHAHCITRIFPRMGETGTTQDIVALLRNRP